MHPLLKREADGHLPSDNTIPSLFNKQLLICSKKCGYEIFTASASSKYTSDSVNKDATASVMPIR